MKLYKKERANFEGKRGYENSEARAAPFHGRTHPRPVPRPTHSPHGTVRSRADRAEVLVAHGNLPDRLYQLNAVETFPELERAFHEQVLRGRRHLVCTEVYTHTQGLINLNYYNYILNLIRFN